MLKRIDGPEGDDEENIDESSGKTKRMRSGSRFDNTDIVLWGGRSEVPLASCGLRLGRPPPNWCTLNPGPPPRLKANCGAVSKPPSEQ